MPLAVKNASLRKPPCCPNMSPAVIIGNNPVDRGGGQLHGDESWGGGFARRRKERGPLRYRLVLPRSARGRSCPQSGGKPSLLDNRCARDKTVAPGGGGAAGGGRGCRGTLSGVERLGGLKKD